jgi:flagellar motor component MotA
MLFSVWASLDWRFQRLLLLHDKTEHRAHERSLKMIRAPETQAHRDHSGSEQATGENVELQTRVGLLDFIVDYLRMMCGGNVNVREMQDLMDEEPATHRAESSVAANADH